MPSSFYYSGIKDVLVDFTNSTDTSGLNLLYTNLKNDLIIAYNNVSLNNKVVGNDTLTSIQIKNTDMDVCITMALGFGFGFFGLNNHVSTPFNVSTYTYYDDLFEDVTDCGQTDVCLFGSKHAYLDSTTSERVEVITNDSYGYDYQRNNSHLYNTSVNGIAHCRELDLGLPQKTTLLIDYSTSGILGASHRKKSLWVVPDRNAVTKRNVQFKLPRYCYGRVSYSIMTKDNGSFAIYLHQTRPRKIGYDEHPDWKHYGVVSVMFYDADNKCAGWIMPQGPSCLGRTSSNARNNYCWSVLSLSTVAGSNSDLATVHTNQNRSYDMYIDSSSFGADILSNTYAVFNDALTTDFNMSRLYCSVINKTGNTYTQERAFYIDEDIMSRGKLTCIIDSIYSGQSSPKESNFRSYQSVSEDISSVRRIRSSDDTVWEWAGAGMIHRVQ